jgi:hypothetical protein
VKAQDLKPTIAPLTDEDIEAQKRMITAYFLAMINTNSVIDKLHFGFAYGMSWQAAKDAGQQASEGVTVKEIRDAYAALMAARRAMYEARDARNEAIEIWNSDNQSYLQREMETECTFQLAQDRVDIILTIIRHGKDEEDEE